MKKALLVFSFAVVLPSFARQGFYDRTHLSRVFGEPRTYRDLPAAGL